MKLYNNLTLVFLVTVLHTVNINSYGQERNPELAKEYVSQAELMMQAAQPLVDVRDIYVLAAEADPSNIIANWRAGDFYLKTVGKRNATQYFLKVREIDPEYRFDIEYWIGRAYHYGMQFDKALEYYTIYRQKLADRDGYRGRDRIDLSEVTRKIYECENAIEFTANPANYAIVNMGSAINSEYEEYGPVLNEDETVLIFTTRRRDGNLNENVFSDNKPYEDIFISVKEDGEWTPAQNIGDVVNTPFHDSNLALSADGRQLFLYKDDNNGDIYESLKLRDGSWSFPSPMSENVNSSGFKESSISISPDGSVLFFASDRPGGQGGIDIYYSLKDRSGEWVRSKNLGSTINTEFDDDAPFIDYDGKTLYFSSLGRKGMGGYDIFKSTYDSAAGEWGEPVNLGFPINTPDDDIFFVTTKDGERGYYASVREDGLGFTDIYMVKFTGDAMPVKEAVPSMMAEPEPVDDERLAAQNTVSQEPKQDKNILMPVVLTLNVTDGSGKPLGARVALQSNDNKTVGKSSRGEGIFEFRVNNEVPQLYRLSIEHPGYVFENIKIQLPGASSQPQEMERSVRMRKLRVGQSSVLRSIYFDFDKASFKDESYNELNKLLNMMAENTGIQIEISGHTDRIGFDDYNKYLSQRRANAVKNFLVNKGIDPRRITSIGYGEERPLVSNDDEKEGRELNRRVEFKVIR